MSRPDAPDRFNEEAATYTVQGGGDLAKGADIIRDVVRGLPTRPGVYRMIDARDNVLYVGKARALKSRVANYMHVTRLPTRLRRMVSQTARMEIVTTSSEAEALLLEAQLIKRFRPPYNVLLRDDKSFPFILVRMDHAFPRVQKHRGARRAKGRYFGPFASAGSVNRTLNAIQKTFLLRSCSDSFFANRSRPCLLYQIRRCSAPCVGRIDEARYAELVDDAVEFLEGKSTRIQRKLGDAMSTAAESMDFELAAVLRDRLRALTFIQGSQAINADGLGDADVFAMAAKAGTVCIAAYFIRGGQNWGTRTYFPAHTAEVSEDEIFAAFLAQFYDGATPPSAVLVNRDLAEAEVLAEAFRTISGRRVDISRPQRGARRRLMEQVERTATEELDRRLAESTTQAKIGRELADVFELDGPPQRIEVYDNSHIQGTNAVGAMIVAGPEGFIKNAYRKFNIRNPDTAPGDDFAMMREVLTRRFSRALDEDPDRGTGQWPDLVLIDGGKGQISAVAAVLAELGIDDVPIVGVAKGPDRNAGRETFHLPDGRELTLAPNSPVLFHIQRLRDEAHRFAIGAHRTRRAKAIGTSPLDDVPGIGAVRKRALLMHFGTARAVRNASLEDLRRVPGVSDTVAQSIYDHFHPGG